ncbi:MAG: hypothetical protein ACYDAO_02900 [Thermoplasmataceae archaeon]
MFSEIFGSATSLVTTSGSFQDVFQRGFEVVISVSAIVIALLWIPVAIGFFSSDEQKRYESKNRLKYASIGTLIYILAISGFVYGMFNFIATGA